MIDDPARYAIDFAEAGASLITFHIEAPCVRGDPAAVIAAIRKAGCRVGISVRPATPVEAVFPYLGEIDLVLVMSVEPGFGGQPFLPETPARLAALRRELHRRSLKTMLQVDGGVNAQTAPLCTGAGATYWLPAARFTTPQTPRRLCAASMPCSRPKTRRPPTCKPIQKETPMPMHSSFQRSANYGYYADLLWCCVPLMAMAGFIMARGPCC